MGKRSRSWSARLLVWTIASVAVGVVIWMMLALTYSLSIDAEAAVGAIAGLATMVIGLLKLATDVVRADPSDD